MNIIIFNGPPDSGKDTSADYLVAKYGYTKLEMKGALRRLAHAMASLAAPNAVELCNRLEFDRALKNTEVRPEFGNRTWRQFLIWISEDVCKPIFGADIFSLAAVKAINDAKSDKITFSDCGFQVEMDTLHYQLCGRITPPKIHLVHMYRPLRTYAQDSRSYVNHPEYGQSPVSIWNDAGVYQLGKDLDVFMAGIGEVRNDV